MKEVAVEPVVGEVTVVPAVGVPEHIVAPVPDTAIL